MWLGCMWVRYLVPSLLSFPAAGAPGGRPGEASRGLGPACLRGGRGCSLAGLGGGLGPRKPEASGSGPHGISQAARLVPQPDKAASARRCSSCSAGDLPWHPRKRGERQQDRRSRRSSCRGGPSESNILAMLSDMCSDAGLYRQAVRSAPSLPFPAGRVVCLDRCYAVPGVGRQAVVVAPGGHWPFVIHRH